MASELGQQIGVRMRERRLKMGMETQAELAEATGVRQITNQVISNYETGKVRPSDERLKLIGGVLGVDLEYFYANRDESAGTPDLMGTMGPGGNQPLEHLEQRLAEMAEQLEVLPGLWHELTAAREEITQLRAAVAQVTVAVGTVISRLEEPPDEDQKRRRA